MMPCIFLHILLGIPLIWSRTPSCGTGNTLGDVLQLQYSGFDRSMNKWVNEGEWLMLTWTTVSDPQTGRDVSSKQINYFNIIIKICLKGGVVSPIGKWKANIRKYKYEQNKIYDYGCLMGVCVWKASKTKRWSRKVLYMSHGTENLLSRI